MKLLNIFEVIHDAFQPFLDGEKKPLNVMEVGNLWFYLAATINSMRNEEIAYNICTDDELKDKLEYAKVKVHLPIKEELEDFLRKEGIPLPDVTPTKPIGNYQNIPEGAKLTDQEIANMLSFNLLLGINYASRGLTESIRADVGMLFSKNMIRKTTFSLSLKDLMEKRGWLQVPPYYKQ